MFIHLIDLLNRSERLSRLGVLPYIGTYRTVTASLSTVGWSCKPSNYMAGIQQSRLETLLHEGRRIQCTLRTTQAMRDLAYDKECSKIWMSTPLALGNPSNIRYTMLCIGYNRKNGISMFDEARSRILTSGKLHVTRSPQIYDGERCETRGYVTACIACIADAGTRW